MNKLKVTYEKVNMSLNDIAKAMIEGAVFYSETGIYSYSWSNYKFLNIKGDVIDIAGDFYRKVETQVSWYDNIPKGGVMCKVWDDSPTIFGYAIISHYDASISDYPFKSKSYMYYSQTYTCNHRWKNAEPLNKANYNFAEDL